MTTTQLSQHTATQTTVLTVRHDAPSLVTSSLSTVNPCTGPAVANPSLLSHQPKQSTLPLQSALKKCFGQDTFFSNSLAIPFKHEPCVYIDNQAAIHCAQNGISNTHIKHLGIRYFFIKQCIDDKLFNVTKIHTSQNLADGFTKPLTQPHHNKLFSQIMNSNLNI